MIRTLATAMCVLSGLFCVAALADRWGLTQPLWQRTLPETVLPRRPSASDTRIRELESQMKTLRQRIETTEEARSRAKAEGEDLLRQLRQRLRDARRVPVEPQRLMEGDAVAAALIRAIDAQDRKAAAFRAKTGELEAELDRLQARRIALRTGLSLVGTTQSPSPSEAMGAEEPREEAIIRYKRIIRDATPEKNQERILP